MLRKNQAVKLMPMGFLNFLAHILVRFDENESRIERFMYWSSQLLFIMSRYPEFRFEYFAFDFNCNINVLRKRLRTPHLQTESKSLSLSLSLLRHLLLHCQ